MRHFYICLLLLGFLSASALASGDKETKDIYTEQYITDIYMDEPERALQLLDEAETKQALPIYMVDDLRSMVYSYLYQDKSAFHYARRAYVHDSISGNNPDHVLKMTIILADLSHTLSDYKESNRYAVEGLELARRLDDPQSECKLLFCMGENKWMLSLKEEGYELFDKAIALLDGRKDKLSKSMLSYFYGVKMGYLINDNRLKDALQVGLQREKLLDGMKGNPEVRRLSSTSNTDMSIPNCPASAICWEMWNVGKSTIKNTSLPMSITLLPVSAMPPLICLSPNNIRL